MWSSPSMLGLMSDYKGLEKKSLQPVAADVLVGEEVAAQKGVEKLLSQLATQQHSALLCSYFPSIWS